MQRKLSNLAPAMSLVLCLAVAWVWRYPRSSNGVPHAIVELPVRGRVVQLSEVSGQLILGLLPSDYRQLDAKTPPAGMSSQRSCWGIPLVGGVISVRAWNGERAVGIIVADWFLVLLTAPLPLAGDGDGL